MRWKNRAWVVAVVVLWVCQGELSVASESCLIAGTAKEQCPNLARSCGPPGDECNGNCSVTASSEYTYDWSGPLNCEASNAVDGVSGSNDYRNYYMSVSGSPADTYFELDLGVEMKIARVWMEGRVDGVPERSEGNKIYVRSSPYQSTAETPLNDATELCSELTTDYLEKDVTGSPHDCNCNFLPMDCSQVRTGRYILVHFGTGDHSMAISELEVYGAYCEPCPAGQAFDPSLKHWLRFENSAMLNYDAVSGGAVGTFEGNYALASTASDFVLGSSSLHLQQATTTPVADPASSGKFLLSNSDVDFDLKASDWTIAFWVKIEGYNTNGRIFDAMGVNVRWDGANVKYAFEPMSSNKNGVFSTVSSVDIVNSITNFFHVAVTFSCDSKPSECGTTSTAEMFYNGNCVDFTPGDADSSCLQKTADAIGGTNTAWTDIMIIFGQMYRDSGNYNNWGWIDDLRIYDRVLTAEEIQALADQYNAATDTGTELLPCEPAPETGGGGGGLPATPDHSCAINTAALAGRNVSTFKVRSAAGAASNASFAYFALKDAEGTTLHDEGELAAGGGGGAGGGGVDLTNGLKLWLKFDDNLDDSSAIGNSLTSSDLFSYKSGKIQNAIQVTSNSELLLSNPENVIATNQTTMSISFWVNNLSKDTNSQTILRFRPDLFKIRYNYNGNKNLEFTLMGATLTYLLTNGITTWKHVVFVANGDDFELYLDGVSVEKQTVSSTFDDGFSHTDPIENFAFFKNSGYTDYARGDFDDLRIYDRVLDQTDIDALYALGEGGSSDPLTNGLSLHYAFDDNLNDAIGIGTYSALTFSQSTAAYSSSIKKSVRMQFNFQPQALHQPTTISQSQAQISTTFITQTQKLVFLSGFIVPQVVKGVINGLYLFVTPMTCKCGETRVEISLFIDMTKTRLQLLRQALLQFLQAIGIMLSSPLMKMGCGNCF